jgi:hypothetical protein
MRRALLFCRSVPINVLRQLGSFRLQLALPSAKRLCLLTLIDVIFGHISETYHSDTTNSVSGEYEPRLCRLLFGDRGFHKNTSVTWNHQLGKFVTHLRT